MTIAKWWASAEARDDWRYGAHLCPDLGEPSCMACGFWSEHWDRSKSAATRWERARLERAHIVAVDAGGTDEPSNFLLLCHACHVSAPMTSSRVTMLEWVSRRESWWARSQRELAAEMKAANVDETAWAEFCEAVPAEERAARFDAAATALKIGLHFSPLNPGGLSAATSAAVIARVVADYRADVAAMR